jgi:DNA-binding IclR family transcriptional regulator
MTAFSITVFNERTMTATEYTARGDTEAEAVEALARQLRETRACGISFDHTSFFCGNPGCAAA